jgi:hypothetical protein
MISSKSKKFQVQQNMEQQNQKNVKECGVFCEVMNMKGVIEGRTT